MESDCDKISDIAEFVKKIKEINDSCERNKSETNEVLYFRGHANIEYQLTPSLARMEVDFICQTERALVEISINEIPRLFNKDMTPLNLLSCMQHYGIPTRLLDITKNPLVALYFACENEADKDGIVYVFKNNETIDNIGNYPIDNAIADIYKIALTDFVPVVEFFDFAIKQYYFSSQKYIMETKNDDEKVEYVKTSSVPRIVSAPYFFERQYMQKGSYILFPNVIDEKNIINKIADLKESSDMIVKKLIIDKDSKEKILNDLNLLGISTGTLFKDSADKRCADIIKRFKSDYEKYPFNSII